MSAWSDHLEHEVQGLVLRSGTNLYPGVATAIAALDWLEAHNAVVLGFDGLDTDGRHIRPRLDRIADFSRDLPADWTERVRLTISAARSTLGTWNDVQFVDLVVDEAEDTEE
jgi:hypothetical protein